MVVWAMVLADICTLHLHLFAVGFLRRSIKKNGRDQEKTAGERCSNLIRSVGRVLMMPEINWRLSVFGFILDIPVF
uniref:Uncharacterized protein n=1 Tax=Oryza punctata TaxID=4537 RepID=A0A0E0MET1_ORYPU